MREKRANKRPRTMADAIQLRSYLRDETITNPLHAMTQLAPPPQPSYVSSSSQAIHPLAPTQPSQSTQPSEATQSTHPFDATQSTNDSGLQKRTRGRAKDINNWGSGVKLKVTFDNHFQPLGKEGIALTGQLGVIVRNPHRAPLNYLSWDVMPEDIKNSIWEEIKDNVEDCPEEYQLVAMRSCRKIWKDHKGRIKAKSYTKHVGDPDILSRVPTHVLPDQWKELVSYWETDEAKRIAFNNSTNRELRSASHNTGRTPFAHIRNEMNVRGERIDKMSIFIKTRDENDSDVLQIVEEFNQHLAEIPEHLQTTEVRDIIFHKVLGEDGHGYCKTYGSGVPRSAVYDNSSGSSNVAYASTCEEITRQVRVATNEIEQRIRIEIEQRLVVEIEQKLTAEIERTITEKFMSHLDRMGARIDSFESGTNGPRQVTDSINGHYVTTKESARDDIQDGEKCGSPSPTSSPIDGQVAKSVVLVSCNIPKQNVAEGLLVSTDPLLKLDGKSLGHEFWKVLVQKATKPNTFLERPCKNVRTVGEVVGHYIAWRSCDVFDEN